MESSSKSWVEAKSLTWTLFVLSLSLTTGWIVFSLTLWGIPNFSQFLYASGLGILAGFAVFALLFSSKYAYLKFYIDSSFDSDESNKDSIIAKGFPSAKGCPSADGSGLKGDSTAKNYASFHAKGDKGLPKRNLEKKTPVKEVQAKKAISGVASLRSENHNVIAISSHKLQPLKNTAQTAAALREFSLSESMEMSVSHATVEPSRLTLGAPHIWTAGLIKTLEWRVFDRLSVTYWAEQGNKILGIKKDFYRRNKFFVCAAANKKIRIAVVQSHSAHSAPISKVEMQYLIKIKEVSNAKVAILMHSGHLSKVVRAFCISNNIRLLNEDNICKGLLALPLALQDQMLDQLVKADYMVPTCPNCRTKMKHRRHKTSDKEVWGCSSYPACRIMMDYYTV